MAIYKGFTWLLLICLINASVADDSVSKRGGEDAAVNAFVEAIKGIYTNLLSSCTINVKNLSKNKLTNFKGMVITGKLENPVANIQPQDTATVVARSGKVKVDGTTGILSWEIENQGLRLVVMWRIKTMKQKQNDKNTLWIALTPSKNPVNLADWKKLMDDPSTEVSKAYNFKKGIYTKQVEMVTLITESGSLKAEGLMGTGKNPTVSIILTAK